MLYNLFLVRFKAFKRCLRHWRSDERVESMADDVKKSSRTYQNLPAIIAGELREAILDGELESGAQLKQEEISRRFDSSLIPVREALRNLETEGLVTFYPNKGAFVSGMSSERAREIFETRILIEKGALAMSIPRLLKKDFKAAQRLVDQLDQAKTGKALSQLNMDFHTILYGRCGNTFLLELIENLHYQVERYMRRYLIEHLNNDLSQEFHRRILSAAEEKKIDEACFDLEQHMRMAMGSLIDALKKEEKEKN